MSGSSRGRVSLVPVSNLRKADGTAHGSNLTRVQRPENPANPGSESLTASCKLRKKKKGFYRRYKHLFPAGQGPAPLMNQRLIGSGTGPVRNDER